MPDAFHRGGTELVVTRPELWSANFYSTLMENHPWAASIDDSYGGEMVLGEKLHISQFPQFPEAGTIAEEAKNDAVAITPTQIDLVVNNQVVQDFIVTDRAKVQTLDSQSKLRDLAAFSIMKKIENIIIAAVVPSAAAPDHSITYVTAGTLALEDILAAIELKDVQDVPDEGRCMNLDAPQWNDIFNISGLTSRDFLTEGSRGALETGSLPGRVLGYNPKMTTLNGGVAYFYHPSFMLLAVQRGMSIKEYDMGAQGLRSTRVNLTVLMGVVQASDIRVVSVS